MSIHEIGRILGNSIEAQKTEKSKKIKSSINGKSTEWLADKDQLCLFYSNKSGHGFTTVAIAYQATVAVATATVAAVASVAAGAKGKSFDANRPLELENLEISGLDINELLKIREEKF